MRLIKGIGEHFISDLIAQVSTEYAIVVCRATLQLSYEKSGVGVP